MTKESAEQNQFNGWAIVEIFGHQRYAGYVSTVNYGVASMFRVDVPELAEREVTLMRPEWAGETYAPIGSVVKREATPGYTKLFGVGAIYCLTPCDEETARRAIESMTTRTVRVISLGEDRRIAAPIGIDDAIDPDDDDDDDDNEETLF